MKHLYTFLTILLISSPFLIAQQTNYSPTIDGGFGGFSVNSESVYSWGGSEYQSWGGIANNNTYLYPIDFSTDGTITFTAYTTDPGDVVDVRFLFENQPFPNNSSTYQTSSVTVNNNDGSNSYSISVPAASATDAYNSFIMYFSAPDIPVYITDIVLTADTNPSLESTYNATLTGSDFTAAEGINYTESGGEGTVEAINASDYTHLYKVSTNGYDFSTGDRGVAISVKGPRSIDIKIKIEKGSDATEQDVSYTGSGEYQTLFADFSSASTIKKYDKIVIFFDITGAASADSADDVFYINRFELGEQGTLSNEIDFEANQFVTYPNPLQNTLNVTGTVDVDQVSIYDLMGRNVLNANPNKSEFSLDVSQLNKGVYMVQLKAGNKETTLKIVK